MATELNAKLTTQIDVDDQGKILPIGDDMTLSERFHKPLRDVGKQGNGYILFHRSKTALSQSSSRLRIHYGVIGRRNS